MSYIKSLQALRERVSNTNPVEEASRSMTPVNPRGFMPSISGASSRRGVAEVPQYEPISFVQSAMSEIANAQSRFQETMAKQQAKAAEAAPSGVGAFAAGFVSRRNTRQTSSDPTEGATTAEDLYEGVNAEGVRNASQGPAGGPEALAEGSGGGLLNLIDSTEGGGSYDTLFGHSQREGRNFSDVRVSQMTIGELKEFSGARGEGSYGSWVQANNPEGSLATPMGRYQFVGTTLASTAEAMGLPDDTVFTPEVQDEMFRFKVRQRLSNASTLPEKRTQLRNEWYGFRHVPNSVLDQAIMEFENEI